MWSKPLEEEMGCPKCKGLMMLERFSDFFLTLSS